MPMTASYWTSAAEASAAGATAPHFAVPFALPVSWVVPSPLVMRQSMVRSAWPQLSDVGRRNLIAYVELSKSRPDEVGEGRLAAVLGSRLETASSPGNADGASG